MISNFVARVLRVVVKLTLLAFGLVVMLGLLLLAVAGLLVALLRFVVTGRKPVAFTAFSAFTQFRQASPQFRRGGRTGHDMGPTARAGQAGAVDGGTPGAMDVVDVQAYEVGAQGNLPKLRTSNRTQ